MKESDLKEFQEAVTQLTPFETAMGFQMLKDMGKHTAHAVSAKQAIQVARVAYVQALAFAAVSEMRGNPDASFKERALEAYASFAADVTYGILNLAQAMGLDPIPAGKSIFDGKSHEAFQKNLKELLEGLGMMGEDGNFEAETRAANDAKAPKIIVPGAKGAS